MPIYEFACDACGKQFEWLSRGNETPTCPECHSEHLNRQLSVPAAHVNGGGSLPVAAPAWSGPCGRGGCGRPECD
jgi:putative FmdB family regulatory protein